MGLAALLIFIGKLVLRCFPSLFRCLATLLGAAYAPTCFAYRPMNRSHPIQLGAIGSRNVLEAHVPQFERLRERRLE